MAVKFSSHRVLANSLNSGCEKHSARLFQCARCHSQLKFCSCCDRGNVYCIDCVVPARQEARQRWYRQRQRQEIVKVRDQGIYISTNVLTEINGINIDVDGIMRNYCLFTISYPEPES